MVVVEGQNIGFKLQLINQDNTYKTDANVSYTVYAPDSTATEIISTRTATWNSRLKVYYDYLNVNVNWLNQSPGNYILVWSLSNVTEFPEALTEELTVVPKISTTESKVDKILGLVHHNMQIDQTEFDDYGNLVSARIRIYSDAASVGTNNNVITSYRIAVDATNCGQFNTWEQVEE